jgi:hypothetical protein
VGACVLRLLVEFVPRTSSTPVATWFWQMEGRSAERVILGVRPSEFILSEFQSTSRRIFIDSHSLPPLLWSPNRSFKTKGLDNGHEGGGIQINTPDGKYSGGGSVHGWQRVKSQYLEGLRLL